MYSSGHRGDAAQDPRARLGAGALRRERANESKRRNIKKQKIKRKRQRASGRREVEIGGRLYRKGHGTDAPAGGPLDPVHARAARHSLHADHGALGRALQGGGMREPPNGGVRTTPHHPLGGMRAGLGGARVGSGSLRGGGVGGGVGIGIGDGHPRRSSSGIKRCTLARCGDDRVRARDRVGERVCRGGDVAATF